MSILDTVTMNSLTSAIQAGQLRQEIYSANIANANTPNYKEKSVQFESLLQNALQSAGFSAQGVPQSQSVFMQANNPLDLSGGFTGQATVAPIVTTDTATSVSGNGNNVNVDEQMSALAENQINYGALVQEMNDQFAMLRIAITGS